MRKEQLEAIRARLEEPPPLIALAERSPGRTALVEYLARLTDDRIALVEEIDRLRAELADSTGREQTTRAEEHILPAQNQCRRGDLNPHPPKWTRPSICQG